jgi:N-methylhydantoinase B/oxoprolinase/acetone carboxylase alpha subunit
VTPVTKQTYPVAVGSGGPGGSPGGDGTVILSYKFQ